MDRKAVSTIDAMTTYNKDIIAVQEVSIEGGSRQTVIAEKGKPVALARHTSLLGIRMIKCKSVVEVSNLLSRDEIDRLVKYSLQAASAQKIYEEETFNNPGEEVNIDTAGPRRVCVRMPTVSAAHRNDVPDAGSEHLHDPLPLELSRYVEERILYRTMAYIDQELPDVKETLFGGDCESLAQLFLDGQLEWSTREPAINVYYPPNGYFGIHKDNKALTILMPLSSPDEDFTGGGTAFWSQLYPNEHRHSPSLVLAPKAGTALLFGGKVSHKGLHIETGTRVVFVASFSRKTDKKKSKTWLVSAR